jgi:hypothetical protein
LKKIMTLRGGIAGLVLLLGLSSCLKANLDHLCRENPFYSWGGEISASEGDGPKMYVFDPTCGCFLAGENILVRVEYGPSMVEKGAGFDSNCYRKNACLPDGRQVLENDGIYFSATPGPTENCLKALGEHDIIVSDVYELAEIGFMLDTSDREAVSETGYPPDACDKKPFYLDNDHDGYGAGNAQYFCEQPSGYSTLPGDCNDGEAKIRPGLEELCNLIDENCDGNTDEGIGGGVLVKEIPCGPDYKGRQTLVCESGEWTSLGSCKY